MADLSTTQGVPLWGPDKAPVTGPAEVKASIEAVLTRSLLRFSSASARDTALTAVGVTTNAQRKGFVVILDTDPAAVQLHDGTTWRRLTAGEAFTGSETAWAGNVPPAGTLKIRQEYTQAALVGASGSFTLTHPVAYSNGITAALVTVGDNASNLGMVQARMTGSLSQIACVAIIPGGTYVASGTYVRVNVAVTGW